MDQIALIVTPPLLTGLVEMGKSMKLIPEGKEKLAVFLLSILFACVYFWNEDLTKVLVAVVGFAVSSVGTYEVGVKPIKNAFN